MTTQRQLRNEGVASGSTTSWAQAPEVSKGLDAVGDDPNSANVRSIEGFVAGLARTATSETSSNPFDFSRPGNADRRHNLGLYLSEMAQRRPAVLLLGEAPGYRGMGITGIPFTNRDIIRNGIEHFALFQPGKGYRLPNEPARIAAEPTATVMWRTLTELDFLPLLWSAYPFHSHQAGNRLSNRTPSAAEIATGLPVWKELAELFDIDTVVAVGNVADRSVRLSSREAQKVRHPAHGGAVKFKQGLSAFLAARVDS